MLKKETQIKYFEERMDLITDNFYNYLLTGESDELHRMRIELKKIKSLLNLSGFCLKNSEAAKKYKQLNKIFKAAGLIRSVGINKIAVKKYQLNDSALDSRHDKLMETYCSDFLSNSYSYEKEIKASFKKIPKSFRNIKNKCLENFFKNHLRNVSILFLEEEPEKNFHKCRKMIKDLVYINDFTSEYLSDKLIVNTFYLGQLEDFIGKWHDSVLTLGFLKNENVDDNEIMNQLIMKIDDLFHSIKSLSQNFSEKAILKVGEQSM